MIAELELPAYGLPWRHGPLAVAHPASDGSCVLLSRNVDETAASLDSFRRGDPLRRLVEEEFGGVGAARLPVGQAAHADLAPETPPSGAVGWVATAIGQRWGVPTPEGGRRGSPPRWFGVCRLAEASVADRPAWPGEHPASRSVVLDDLDEFTLAAAQLAMGLIPAKPFLGLGHYSMVDPGRSLPSAGCISPRPRSTPAEVCTADRVPSARAALRWDRAARCAEFSPGPALHEVVLTPRRDGVCPTAII